MQVWREWGGWDGTVKVCAGVGGPEKVGCDGMVH